MLEERGEGFEEFKGFKGFKEFKEFELLENRGRQILCHLRPSDLGRGHVRGE